MEVFIYVLLFFVAVLFWMKFLGWLGSTLGSALIFIEESMEELEKFLSPEIDIPKEVPLRDGDPCPCCEKEQVKERSLAHLVLTEGDSRHSLKYLWCLVCQKSFPHN